MNRFISIMTSAFVTTLVLSTPIQASSDEYVVLESITAVNSTVILGENLEYELVVSSPKSFAWDPKGSNWDGYLRIVLCRTEMVTLNSNPEVCQYQNLQSRFLLTKVDYISESLINSRNTYRFKVYGKPITYEIGEYFVYLVRIPNANENDTDETHLYYINRESAVDIFGSNRNIQIPSFSQTKIYLVEELPVIDNQPEQVVEDEIIDEELELDQEVEENTETEDIVTQQTPEAISPPTRNAGSSQPAISIPAPTIASNLLLPSIKGDQNWSRLTEIKGNFENWKVANKNSLEGVPVRFTKINGSLITFTTTGNAVSVRYLAGKKRGSFSIYLNGKFLDRIDTSKKKKQNMVKTWDNLGEGKHYIDIVAELDNGKSLAISGVQKLKN